jgi:hypothetical protein
MGKSSGKSDREMEEKPTKTQQPLGHFTAAKVDEAVMANSQAKMYLSRALVDHLSESEMVRLIGLALVEIGSSDQALMDAKLAGE